MIEAFKLLEGYGGFSFNPSRAMFEYSNKFTLFKSQVILVMTNFKTNLMLRSSIFAVTSLIGSLSCMYRLNIVLDC